MNRIKMIKMQIRIKTKSLGERRREKQLPRQQVGWMCGLSGALLARQLVWVCRSASGSSRLVTHYAQCKQTASQRWSTMDVHVHVRGCRACAPQNKSRIHTSLKRVCRDPEATVPHPQSFVMNGRNCRSGCGFPVNGFSFF